MINQDALAFAASILSLLREHIFAGVIRGLKRLFSRRMPWFIGLICSASMIPLSINMAAPLPPIVCIEGATDCGVSSLPSSEPKKWHPGHYMQLSLGESKDSALRARFQHYDRIANNTQIQGVSLRIKWGQLEGAEGQYTFDTLQKDLDYLKNLAIPKRLFVRIHDRGYGRNLECATNSIFPSYLRNQKGCIKTGNGTMSRIWTPYVQDRLIALYEAMAEKWDDDPYFEGVYLIRETATNGRVNDDSEYLKAAHLEGLRRIAKAADAIFVKSNAIMPINWVEGRQSNVDELIAFNADLDIGQGGPDTLNPECSPRRPPAYNTIIGDSGGVDYRGFIPVMYSIEATQMGGGLGNCTPNQIRDFANDVLHASHLFWSRNTYAGSPAQQWNEGILPYISDPENNLTHTNCVASDEQGCDTN